MLKTVGAVTANITVRFSSSGITRATLRMFARCRWSRLIMAPQRFSACPITTAEWRFGW